MVITVPAAGDPVTATWGASVANQLNTQFPIVVTADVAMTSSSMADITGLSFPVVTGAVYVLDLHLFYTVGGTNTGIVIGYTAPGTNDGRLLVQIFGNASATGTTTDWVTTEDDTSLGTTTTDSTSTRLIRVHGRLAAAGNGTFQLRYARRGTSTTVTVLEGSGGTVIYTP